MLTITTMGKKAMLTNQEVPFSLQVSSPSPLSEKPLQINSVWKNRVVFAHFANIRLYLIV